ncbi:MAG: hypothetical protein IJI01_02520 [Butyrivibrio sp.]|uniref:sensor histidine kinase n=1 Tax=Butyrivibrio sp. TaxID=28121 RepID=UPI0025C2616D|nr:HAMP domain-containing sensor histidine kinase [Butyrivibrio sp.]MBQ6587535.1 hypothetical protein [Butyrivibrio sp.]
MADKRRFEQPGVDSNTVAELSKKLLEANAKLQEAELERKIMLENISHDLRAPLTAIRSAIDYIKAKGEGSAVSPEELADMIRLIDNRAQTLEVLVQDLYYLTCLENGRDELKVQRIPLTQFLEEYFFAAQIDDRFAKRELVFSVPEDYDRDVMIDVGKMSRVLDNLFTNARKYSEDGAEIELGVDTTSDSAVFYVRDTGIGIPEDAIDHIFDRTYRVSGARTPGGESSSGLGLSIVKSIVGQHQGRIWCESTLGQGSCFYVELPVNA